MIILKGFKTCVVIDSREEKPDREYLFGVERRFFDKIINGDLINRVEVYHKRKFMQSLNNGVEGGLTNVDSLKYLNLK